MVADPGGRPFRRRIGLTQIDCMRWSASDKQTPKTPGLRSRMDLVRLVHTGDCILFAFVQSWQRLATSPLAYVKGSS